MNNVLALAVAGVKIDKEVRNAVSTGKYAVDSWVHVQGTVSVGADYDTAPTVSLPVLEILALFVARAGITREASMKLLREVAGEAIAATGGAAGSIVAEVEAVKDALEVVKRQVIDTLPRQTRKGPVKVSVTLTEGVENEAA
jgi:hypothetical protein